MLSVQVLPPHPHAHPSSFVGVPCADSNALTPPWVAVVALQVSVPFPVDRMAAVLKRVHEKRSMTASEHEEHDRLVRHQLSLPLLCVACFHGRASL